MLDRFQKEEKLEAVCHRQNDRNAKSVEETTTNRCPERIILLAPGRKVPWSRISRNHGTFKVSDLHDAAKKLHAEKLGETFALDLFSHYLFCL